jgi:hypothetical protein
MYIYTGYFALVLIVVNVATILYLVACASRVRNIWGEIIGFVSPPAEGQPSPLAVTGKAIADQIGASIVNHLKAYLANKESLAVRQANAVEGDLALDIASQNQLLNVALASFPNLRKTLRKNPALLGLALERLGGSSSLVASAPGVPGNGHVGGGTITGTEV